MQGERGEQGNGAGVGQALAPAWAGYVPGLAASGRERLLNLSHGDIGAGGAFIVKR